ncbi:uncharacterized protein LOC116312804 isoform X2 [Oreochromis aureus]|uniref:uncharacterized protein LOC116312804 isoform X2 n=1 Tax=Oreochromis aureus TaxID=47969 RepID=UPI00195391DF|nr:uncharacterized protein LOC116312804 isoform X2 [Oreochromis aureus]
MVPVLLTPDMIAAMELLAKARSECQVRTENVYLFARPGVLSHYRGSDCFRKYSNKCGAKYPEALTSTRLRKQVATLSTVLNLKENEMDQLATFLGHDIRVHREFYRLPESTLQLAKVSKLLIAMEKGKLSDLQGKGLDDIAINPEDEVVTSDDDSSGETITDPQQHKGSRTKNSGNQSHTLYSASWTIWRALLPQPPWTIWRALLPQPPWTIWRALLPQPPWTIWRALLRQPPWTAKTSATLHQERQNTALQMVHPKHP